MPRLRGVEITDAAADDFEHYFHGLREDQVIYISPTKSMPAERILAISGGRWIVLQMKMEKPAARLPRPGRGQSRGVLPPL
jgi:hypothetical protein